MVKNFKIFSRTKKALRPTLDIKHLGLKVYQVCSNAGRRLTFDLFMARSNLCPLTFICMGKILKSHWDNLKIFGRDIYQIKKVCSRQDGQLLLCWFFYPNKQKACSFTFTRHLFLLLFLNMYTHKFKIYANIVYPVQIMRSEVIIRWFWQK